MKLPTSYSRYYPDTVYGPFAKREGEHGPQEAMHHRFAELDRSDLRFIAEDTSVGAQKRYWLMTSRALEAVIERNREDRRNNCFYEIMPSPTCTYASSCRACSMKLKRFACRAYLDLEFPDPCDFDAFEMSTKDKLLIGEEIAQLFADFLSQTYSCEASYIMLKSHRPGKYSWHVVYKTFRGGKPIFFRNSLTLLTAMKAFFEQGYAKPYLSYDPNEKGETSEKNIIDDSVYSTHKLYRTMGSQKYGRLTGPFVHASGDLENFSDSLVLQTPSADALFFDLEESVSTTKILCKKRSGGSSSSSAVAKRPRAAPVIASGLLEIFSKLSLWKETFRFIMKKFPTLEMSKLQVKSFSRIYIPLDRDKRCPLKRGGGKDGSHRNNHCCLAFYPQKATLYWRCQKQECRALGASVLLPFPLPLRVRWEQLFSRKHTIEYLRDR